MEPVVYSACPLANFDAVTGVCSNPVWLQAAPGMLPPLSVQDGILISTAIVSVWAVGFGFKMLRKFLYR